MRIFPAKPSGGVLIWRNIAYILTPVEYQILMLVVTDAPISSAAIGAKVFSVSPPDAWQRMVSAYIGRLRRKVDMRLINASKEGYRLGTEIESSESRMSGAVRVWERQRA